MPRFSIKTLLAVTAIVALDLAWIASGTDYPIVVAKLFGTHLLAVCAIYVVYGVVRNGSQSVVLNSLVGTVLVCGLLALLVLGHSESRQYGREQWKSPNFHDPGYLGQGEMFLISVSSGVFAVFASVIVALAMLPLGHLASLAASGQYRGRVFAVTTACATTTLLTAAFVFIAHWKNVTWLPFFQWIVLCNLVAVAVSYPFGKITDDQFGKQSHYCPVRSRIAATG